MWGEGGMMMMTVMMMKKKKMVMMMMMMMMMMMTTTRTLCTERDENRMTPTYKRLTRDGTWGWC